MEGKFYILGDVLPFSEDKTHEFKAHKNICVEDLPHWCFLKGTMRRTRRAVSRSLNGFLNTGLGGTVYLGVLDDGSVKGLELLAQQRDHLQAAVEDVMTRYEPVVPSKRYEVVFVPVFSKEEVAAAWQEDHSVSASDSGYLSSGEASTPPDAAHHQKPLCKLQLQSHKLRSPTYCWCDQLAISTRFKGVKIPSYVMEIVIHPFQYRVDLDPTILQLHPVYEDEEGRVYMRGAASLHCMTHQEVADMTIRQTRDHFERVLKGLRKELLDCERDLVARHRAGGRK